MQTTRNNGSSVKHELILQTFLPLFVLLLVKKLRIKDIKDYYQYLYGDFSSFNVMLMLKICVLIFCIVFSLGGLISLYSFCHSMQDSGFTSRNEHIEIIKHKSEEGLIFLVSYIIPLSMNNVFDTLNSFIFFILIIVLIYLLVNNSELFYQNPILICLGYRVVLYKIIERDETQFIGIIRRNFDETKAIKAKNIVNNINLIINA